MNSRMQVSENLVERNHISHTYRIASSSRCHLIKYTCKNKWKKDERALLNFEQCFFRRYSTARKKKRRSYLSNVRTRPLPRICHPANPISAISRSTSLARPVRFRPLVKRPIRPWKRLESQFRTVWPYLWYSQRSSGFKVIAHPIVHAAIRPSSSSWLRLLLLSAPSRLISGKSRGRN